MTPLFAHQEAAYRALLATAEVFFHANWRRLSVITPRFTRLLVGPSGTGKTHLVRRLARELDVPMLEIASATWIPLGCADRAGCSSWKQIATFCHDHRQGIIFIDEVDKLGERSSWMTHLRVEIFAALDRTIPVNLSWELDEECGHADSGECRAHAARVLRERMLVVGGGAFQDLWETKNPKTMGFGANAPPPPGIPEQHELAMVIPAEIANRFVTPPLILPPMDEGEYRLLLARLCKCLPGRLATRVRAAGNASIGEAVHHGLGCRWAERLILEALTAEREETTLRQQDLGI